MYHIYDHARHSASPGILLAELDMLRSYNVCVPTFASSHESGSMMRRYVLP